MIHRTFIVSLILQLITVSSVFANPVSDQSLFLFLRVTGQAVHVDKAVIKPVACYPVVSQTSDYRYTLLSKTNQPLYTGYFPDPLFVFEDDFSDPHQPKGGMKQVNKNSKLLKVPYLNEAVRIQFERKGKKENQWHPRGISDLSKLINGEVGQ